MLIGSLTSELCERGVSAQQANLAAQVGMATLSHAVAAWFEDDSIELGEYIVRAFEEVRDLVASSPEMGGGKRETRTISAHRSHRRQLCPPGRVGQQSATKLPTSALGKSSAESSGRLVTSPLGLSLATTLRSMTA